MGSRASPLEARAQVVINPGEDGGQQGVAGRLFVPASCHGRRYAARRSIAVRISEALRLLLYSWLEYFDHRGGLV